MPRHSSSVHLTTLSATCSEQARNRTLHFTWMCDQKKIINLGNLACTQSKCAHLANSRQSAYHIGNSRLNGPKNCLHFAGVFVFLGWIFILLTWLWNQFIVAMAGWWTVIADQSALHHMALLLLGICMGYNFVPCVILCKLMVYPFRSWYW